MQPIRALGSLRLAITAPVGALPSVSAARSTGQESFRPDIEGLRGVAVLAVVLYHAFPQTLPGGFLGVDVFFVISGFLITQLLWREVEATGGINLVEFWARRIRRILPAAIFVLCAVAVLALVVPSVDGRDLGRHIIAATFSYYNWRQVTRQVDYLAQDDRDNPLLHYWSLGVEEQFYLVWPVLLLALFAWARGKPDRRYAVLSATALLAAASFMWALSLTASAPSFAFFGTPARAWQLLTGALVAMLSLAPSRHLGAVAVASGLALLVSFFSLSDAALYSGVSALAPTLAAAGLLACGAHSTFASTGLSWSGLRYVGRVSFSWYLWHWPLIVLFGATALGLSAALAVSFAAAAATYAFIEQPVRTSKAMRRSPLVTYVFGAALLALGGCAGLGMKYFAPDDVPIGPGLFVSRDDIASDRPVIYKDHCLLRFEEVRQEPCVYGDVHGSKTVLLVGDSHAGNWFAGLDRAAKTLHWRLVVRIKASCRPIDVPQKRSDGRDYPECDAWLRRVLADLKAIKPDLVVVGGTAHNLPEDGERRVIEKLAAAAPTIVMRSTPRLPEAPAVCLKRVKTPAECTWPLSDLLVAHSYPKTRATDLPEGARVVDLNHRLCPQERCSAVSGGRVLMFDDHHVSNSFAATLAPEFENLLRTSEKRLRSTRSW